LVNDGSRRNHVRPLLDRFAKTHPRIVVKHLDRHEGAAQATSRALGLAQGEFVGFLNQDDELASAALLEVIKLLNRDRGLDLIYSDADRMTVDGKRIEPFFKPDWSPDLLLSMNYLSHFLVVRRELINQLGGCRSSFDDSYDYDLVLRATERTERIGHIP